MKFMNFVFEFVLTAVSYLSWDVVGCDCCLRCRQHVLTANSNHIPHSNIMKQLSIPSSVDS